jgi:mannose-6-phosphate isomerase-like protein (cupin superfamily)
MEPVSNVDEHRWVDESLSGARGYDSMEILANEPEYTSAFSCEYVRLPPGAHPLTHVEEYNHLLFFVEGSGEITTDEKTGDLRPGSYANVKAGHPHSLRNLRDGDMLILTVYDPPRDSV